MKLLLLLLCVSFGASAQQQRVNKSVNDDGKTLDVHYEINRNGKHVRYDRTFKVNGLSAAEKDRLVSRIEDSLGVNLTPPTPPTQPTSPTPPAPAVAPTPPTPLSPSDADDAPGANQVSVLFTCESCTGKIRLLIDSETGDFSYAHSFSIDKTKPLFPYQISLQPGPYRLKYYQNDVLQIQSTFTVKSDEKNTVVVK